MNSEKSKNTAISVHSHIFNMAHENAVKLEDIRNQHLKNHLGKYSSCCTTIVLNAQKARNKADEEWIELQKIISS